MPDTQPRYNRDDDLKPGRPPQSATRPGAGGKAAQSGKTLTDPDTGEPAARPPKPNASRHDDR